MDALHYECVDVTWKQFDGWKICYTNDKKTDAHQNDFEDVCLNYTDG